MQWLIKSPLGSQHLNVRSRSGPAAVSATAESQQYPNRITWGKMEDKEDQDCDAEDDKDGSQEFAYAVLYQGTIILQAEPASPKNRRLAGFLSD